MKEVKEEDYVSTAKGIVEFGIASLIRFGANSNGLDQSKLLAHVYALVGCSWIAGASSNRVSETELIEQHRHIIDGIKAEIKDESNKRRGK